MRNKYLAILALIPLALTTSCGGKGGAISMANAQFLAGKFVGDLQRIRPGAAPSLPSDGMPGGASTGNASPRAADPCVTTSPDQIKDDDTDGIALYKEMTFDCSGTNHGWSYKGTVKITDLDDTKAWILGGYLYEYDSQSSFEEANGHTGGYDYKGFWKSEALGDDAVYTSDFTAIVRLENMPAPYSGSANYTLESKWRMVVRGENPNTPWLAGTYSGTGTYVFTGTFPTEDASGKHYMADGTASMEFRSIDLTYDHTCTQFYKSGKWEFTDPSGNILVIEYHCSSRKEYLNGVEINPQPN